MSTPAPPLPQRARRGPLRYAPDAAPGQSSAAPAPTAVSEIEQMQAIIASLESDLVRAKRATPPDDVHIRRLRTLLTEHEDRLVAHKRRLDQARQETNAGSALVQQRLEALYASLMRPSTDTLGWTPPWLRTEAEQEAFKEKLSRHWECADTPPAAASTSASASGSAVAAVPSRLKCMVVNQLLPRSEVVAAHSWPVVSRYRLHAFQLRTGDIDQERYGLMLCDAIERAYRAQCLSFVYHPFMQQFHLRVMDPQLRNEQVCSTGITFAQIDHSPLQLPDAKWPDRRSLHDQFKRAMHEWEWSVTQEERMELQTLLDLGHAIVTVE